MTPGLLETERVIDLLIELTDNVVQQSAPLEKFLPGAPGRCAGRQGLRLTDSIKFRLHFLAFRTQLLERCLLSRRRCRSGIVRRFLRRRDIGGHPVGHDGESE